MVASTSPVSPAATASVVAATSSVVYVSLSSHSDIQQCLPGALQILTPLVGEMHYWYCCQEWKPLLVLEQQLPQQWFSQWQLWLQQPLLGPFVLLRLRVEWLLHHSFPHFHRQGYRYEHCLRHARRFFLPQHCFLLVFWNYCDQRPVWWCHLGLLRAA